ncbi:Uncharacterised protein [Enterobacter bugandensis]|uniref:Uncharacterized protein n=1 Tax=Enterobacter bugandensis TaxID=881260 RepID=A0A822WRN5_9ENTR|nr:Uncharacterised protein [Enterobacter bugandensis]
MSLTDIKAKNAKPLEKEYKLTKLFIDIFDLTAYSFSHFCT